MHSSTLSDDETVHLTKTTNREKELTQLLQSFTKLSSSLQIEGPVLGKPMAALSIGAQGVQGLEGSASKGARVFATTDLGMGPNPV